MRSSRDSVLDLASCAPASRGSWRSAIRAAVSVSPPSAIQAYGYNPNAPETIASERLRQIEGVRQIMAGLTGPLALLLARPWTASPASRLIL